MAPQSPVITHAILAAPAVATLGLYLKTRFPTVPGGDAGELLAEACHLGTAHPPGYPLFTMLMHAVMKLAPSSPSFPPAAAANSACCFMGASTAYFLSLATHRFILGQGGGSERVEEIAPYAAALSGSMFALSPLTWEYSVGAEVFALHNTFVAGILLFTARVATSKGRIGRLFNACVGSLLCGLAMANQHTAMLFILVLVPYVAFVVFVRGREDLKMLGALAFLFFCGLAPYAYLVYASLGVRDGSWGDMTTFEGLKRHVFREEVRSERRGRVQESAACASHSF